MNVCTTGESVFHINVYFIADAQYLYDLGRALNLFVGEGMWTRFFPAVEYVR